MEFIRLRHAMKLKIMEYCSPVRYLWLLAFILPAQGSEVSARVISYSCYGCHAAASKSNAPGIPQLQALSAAKMRQKLLDFKYDRQQVSIMNRISKGYSDQELTAVAHYLSKQP